MSSTFKVLTKKINYNRIFLLSDLHFGVRSNSLEWLQNQLQFFKEFYIPFLKENVKKGDILFFLGDFFDNRQLLDIYVMNSAIDIVIELSSILPIYFITGNHDIYKKYDTDVNSIVAFRFIKNVHIFEKPIIVTNEETKILLLPWVGNKDNEEKYVKENLGNFDYVFAHMDIAGFRYDNGRMIHAGVNLSKIKGIKKLFSGHIHKRQSQKNLYYIGSPYHTKRSDIGNKKGVYIFDPQEDKFEFVINNLSSLFQRIKLENILELDLKQTKAIFNNNYTDIIVPDKYIHLFNLTKFIEILNDCSYKKIEAVGEKGKLEDELSGVSVGVNVKDILTLLEMSIDDLGHQMELLIKLKILNKKYYELSQRDEEENW